VSDGASSSRSGEGLDAATLRARLGLRSITEPASIAATPSDIAASPPVANYDDELTPVPVDLTVTLQEGDVELDAPGGDRRIPMKPAIIAMLIVSIVGVLLGQVLGESLGQREQKDAHQRIVAKKLSLIRDSTTQSGDKVIEAIAEMEIALTEAVIEIDALEASGAEPLKFEKVFEGLLPKLITYKREVVYVEPDRVMDGMTIIYADDLMLEATRFAVRTQHLYDIISMAIEEATALAKIGRPGGAAQQTIYAERYERALEDGKKVPAARGKWVKDTGKPDLVKLVEEGSKKSTMQWQMMVLTQGAKDPVQVPTDRIVSLDMKPIYEKYGINVRKHTVMRLGALVRKARGISKKLGWKPLERRLEAWVAPE
jgi:hypothetical protein